MTDWLTDHDGGVSSAVYDVFQGARGRVRVGLHPEEQNQRGSEAGERDHDEVMKIK